MLLKHRKYSVHERHEWSHTHGRLPLLIISYSTCHFLAWLSSTRSHKESIWESSWWYAAWEQMRCYCVFFTIVCRFAEKRPWKCTDWWEGMIYVAPVSQLSSGPLSLIMAIRLPLHRGLPCLHPAITGSLLSHIHKGKGRILSPHLALQKHRDAKMGAIMCSGALKVTIYPIIAVKKAVCYPAAEVPLM